MKWKYFLSAMRYESGRWGLLLMLLVALSAMCILGSRFVSLSMYGADLFFWLLIIVAFNATTPTGTCGLSMQRTMSRPGGLEFLFSRALPKPAIFFAKVLIYLAICILPLVSASAYSRWHPEAQVVVLPTAREQREKMVQFYTEHFGGVQVERNKESGDILRVRLLSMGAPYADYRIFIGAVMALLCQFGIFLFPKCRWVPLTLIVGGGLLFIGASYVPSGGWVSSLYGAGLVWCTHHGPLAFAFVGILAVLVEVYCCRRFVNLEIES